MARTERFHIGFLIQDRPEEQLFLSVTPGLEHGPGIQRDGITAPRMTDPHSVAAVCNHYGIEPNPTLPPTTDPYVQRAGTWTIYHHLKHFLKHRGNEWTLVGIQSNGDLTMNPWHVAYIGKSHLPGQDATLVGLLVSGDVQEPFHSRIYRSLVKWNDEACKARQIRYECLSLRIQSRIRGYTLTINDPDIADKCDGTLKNVKGYDSATRDLSGVVEFALSAKPVVEEGVELTLANVIDRFEDIRHIFNLPTVDAKGFYKGQEVKQLNFGEYQLFANLNERRAALFSPIIIDLDIDDRVKVEWNDVATILRKRHFREVPESPARRGEFRRYREQVGHEKVEIFFPHNVYPFGVLGIQTVLEDHKQPDNIVCLSSGGLSGRVGNTLEGIGRIMFDFFGCGDAMVLDEGYDVFFISNPPISDGRYKYTNEQMLKKVLTFTRERADADQKSSLGKSSRYCGTGMMDFPLNEELFREIEEDSKSMGTTDYSDVLLVEPQRCQMRSVLIFAAKN